MFGQFVRLSQRGSSDGTGHVCISRKPHVRFDADLATEGSIRRGSLWAACNKSYVGLLRDRQAVEIAASMASVRGGQPGNLCRG